LFPPLWAVHVSTRTVVHVALGEQRCGVVEPPVVERFDQTADDSLVLRRHTSLLVMVVVDCAARLGPIMRAPGAPVKHSIARTRSSLRSCICSESRSSFPIRDGSRVTGGTLGGPVGLR